MSQYFNSSFFNRRRQPRRFNLPLRLLGHSRNVNQYRHTSNTLRRHTTVRHGTNHLDSVNNTRSDTETAILNSLRNRGAHHTVDNRTRHILSAFGKFINRGQHQATLVRTSLPTTVSPKGELLSRISTILSRSLTSFSHLKLTPMLISISPRTHTITRNFLSHSRVDGVSLRHVNTGFRFRGTIAARLRRILNFLGIFNHIAANRHPNRFGYITRTPARGFTSERARTLTLDVRRHHFRN